EYQTIMAQNGLIPAKASLVDAMGDDPVAQAAAAAAQNTRIPPATPGWANVESARIMEDLFQSLAQGNDVAAAAAEADQRITEALTEGAEAPGRDAPRPGACRPCPARAESTRWSPPQQRTRRRRPPIPARSAGAPAGRGRAVWPCTATCCSCRP